MGGVAGIALGWRPELARFFSATDEPGDRLGFAEVIAESLRPERLPDPVAELAARGLPVVPHGVSLGLGSNCGSSSSGLIDGDSSSSSCSSSN